jgi:hypothetical protein
MDYQSQDNMTSSIIENFVKAYEIDKRITVLDLSIKDDGKVVTIEGFVQDQELKSCFLNYCNGRMLMSIIEKICVVNNSNKEKKGLIRVSVANLHKDPSLSSPLVTQALMGTVVTVIKTIKDWARIQLPDGYIGWISETVTFISEDEYQRFISMPKVIVTALHEWIYLSIEMDCVVSDTVVGNTFEVVEEIDTCYKVVYPDHRTGFIRKQSVLPLQLWLNSGNITEQTITETAKSLTGIPYLWGGTSSKAVDCSGFSWLTYYLNGLLLPRDADQQALIGKEIVIDTEFTHVSPGDLLFFGRREFASIDNSDTTECAEIPITHVGISLGRKRYIQSSGDVHLSSFDPADTDFDKRRSESLLRIRRIIGVDGTPGIKRVNQIPGFLQNGKEKE